MQKYIHNYEQQLISYKKKLDSSNISMINKKLIKEFERDCTLKEKIALPTLIKYYDVLLTIAEKYTKKDFNKLTKEDFENIIEQINNRDDTTVSTKQKYWAIIKKFGRWLSYGDKMFLPNGAKQYPETIAWINTTIKAKDAPRIKASAILTEDEIDKLIASVQHPRDKAFISCLYETGARIGDLGGIKIKDLTEDKYGFLIDLSKGKTGERCVRIVFSSGKLTQWLNQHPTKEDRNSNVWVCIQHDRIGNKNRILGTPLDYRSLYKIIERAKEKANINKRIYPHLFRHSRVTHLLMNKQINESQAKVYFGWTPGSDILANYSHLTSSQVNDTMLEINGLKKSETSQESKIRTCPNCGKHNDKKDSFCGYCSRPLDFKTLMEIQEKERIASKGFKIAMEKHKSIDKNILKEVIKDMIKNGEILV